MYRTTRKITCYTCFKLALHPKQLAQRSLNFIFHFVSSVASGTQLLISNAYVRFSSTRGKHQAQRNIQASKQSKLRTMHQSQQKLQNTYQERGLVVVVSTTRNINNGITVKKEMTTGVLYYKTKETTTRLIDCN